MSVKICPYCQSRFMKDNNSGDFVHDCSAGNSEFLRTEDKLKMISKTNPDGSSQNSVLGGREFMNLGISNKLFGTRASIDDSARVHSRTKRGSDADLFEARTHFEFIE